VNEAGLISARVAPAEVEANVPPSRPLEEVARARAQGARGRRLFAPAQLAVSVVATGIAFQASLRSLAAGFPGHLALGGLGAVPLIALLLALGIAIRRHPPEPDIHDRYLDYILGLGLLGAATAAMWFLPGSMSIFFWSWRLDLVWLPVFAAGAIALLCGARALWRYRAPIVFLLLAWPLPDVVAGVPAALSAAAIASLGLLLLALPFAAKFSLQRLAVTLPPPPAGERRGGGFRVGGGVVAAGLVCVAVVLTTVADRQLEAAGPLLEPDGQPKLTATLTPALTLDGLSGVPIFLPRTSRRVGWGPSSQSYRYTGGQATLPGTGVAGDSGVIVDVMAPADGRALALSPTTMATLQGYRLEASRLEDLGGGVAAHVDRYRAPGEQLSLLVVWWDWPVRSAGGSRLERIIVQRLLPADQATRADLVAFARALAGSMIDEASRAS
jgi:hypothetical protein